MVSRENNEPKIYPPKTKQFPHGNVTNNNEMINNGVKGTGIDSSDASSLGRCDVRCGREEAQNSTGRYPSTNQETSSSMRHKRQT